MCRPLRHISQFGACGQLGLPAARAAGDGNDMDCHYYYPERCLLAIDRIRSNGAGDKKYSYCDVNQNYVPEYANEYSMLDTESVNNFLSTPSDQMNIFNILFYSGFIQGLAEFGIGLLVPARYAFFVDVASALEAIGKNDPTSFAAALAALAGFDELSKALGLLGVYEGTDVSLLLGDYVVEIKPMANLEIFNIKAHFSESKTLKRIKWNWLPE